MHERVVCVSLYNFRCQNNVIGEQEKIDTGTEASTEDETLLQLLSLHYDLQSSNTLLEIHERVYRLYFGCWGMFH